MSSKKIKNKIRENGSVLAYALVLMFIMSIILTSMLSYIVSQLKFSFNRVDREAALQIAEAGVEWYRWYLEHETSGKTAQQIQDFWSNEHPLGLEPNPYEADYQGIGKYSIDVQPPTSGSTIINIEATGWTYRSVNTTRTIRVRFRRPSWSEYMFLSDSFMNFGDESEVWGKVYSNSGIRFDGLAHNSVESLLPSFDDPTYGGQEMEFGVHTTINPKDPEAPDYPWPDGTVPSRPDIFKGGRDFPVPQVSFTGVTTDLANMKVQAQGGNGIYFDNAELGRKILLKDDGTFDVCTVSSANKNSHAISKFKKTSGYGTCNYCDGACVSNYAIPNNGVIFVENNAWVDGSINNKNLTIVAANLSGGGASADIYIGTENKDLRYASYDCNNKLGLVAQRDIRVLGSCPNDYTVDAALLAQTGAVGINDNAFSGKNSLTFNGAIASYLQPYFQHGISGFAVRFYDFDNDLLYCPPPFFPAGTEYSVDLWQEV